MQNVLILGFGKTGQAFYHYLKGQAELWVYDDKALSDPSLKPFDASIHYDYALISPGIAPAHKMWAYCRTQGIPVFGEIEYAFQQLKGKVIGITGTNGKTTTTTLVYEMYKAHHERTFLAGNIGLPLLDYVADSREGDIYVTELSSFQLETTEYFLPALAAITNITPDHITWHETMENYIHAKFKIFRKITDYRQVIINMDDAALCRALRQAGYDPEEFTGFSHEIMLSRGCYVDQQAIWYRADRAERIIALEELALSGVHNLENMLCAVALAKGGGVSIDAIRHVLRTFKGVAHRYEVLGERCGRRFINDSKATNPESTIPALRSVIRPTVLIAGGMDKKSDFREMFELMNEKVIRVFLFGENKDMMLEQVPPQKKGRFELVEDLDEAFRKALQCSEAGYDILLSPASASWDMYPSFEVRGDHFRKLVGELDV